jgi:hypothetical protein
MFYNFTALTHHYASSHKEFEPAKFMCLYDGIFYPDFETLKQHIANHKPPQPRIQEDRIASHLKVSLTSV